jgi:hypothetical protein
MTAATATRTRTSTREPFAAFSLWADEGLPAGSVSRLTASGVMPASATGTFEHLTGELADRLEHHQPLRAIDMFLANGSTWEDRLDRRACVLLLAYLGQLRDVSLPWPGWQPDDPNTRRRVLTGIERTLVRFCSLASDPSAASVGALDAGAASGELSKITRHHVIVDNDAEPHQLAMPGTERSNNGGGHSPAAPRTLDLPVWCRPRYTRQLAATFTDGPLLCNSKADVEHKIQSAILMNVTKVLASAGLGDDPTVQPLSIRNTAARAVRDEAGIEAAAQLIGIDDLMAVGREIGIRPHPVRRVR